MPFPLEAGVYEWFRTRFPTTVHWVVGTGRPPFWPCPSSQNSDSAPNWFPCAKHMLFFKKDSIYILLGRGEEKEIERERNIINVRELYWSVASCTSPTGDLAHNPGMCPDWESNQQPFGSQASTQSTEPHQRGQGEYFLISSHTEAARQSPSLCCASRLTQI